MFAVQFTMSVVEVRGLRRPFDFAYAAGVFKLVTQLLKENEL